MNDKDAEEWADNKRKTEKSDGCTMAPDFDFTECCERHDMMRRFNVGIPDKQADEILRDCIIKKGHPIKAKFIYYPFVRISSKMGGYLNVIALFSILIVSSMLYLYG